MIIGINGYAGTGKDTIGRIIQFLNCESTGDITLEEFINDPISHDWWVEEQSGWEIKKYAGKLKQIASLLTGIPMEKFEDQEFKKTYLNSEWSIDKPYCSTAKWIFDGETYSKPMTVRDFLQKLGTDGLRNGLHPNVWVNALMADYTTDSNWIVTDVRFPNEAIAIKEKDGILIRVDRPGVKPVNNHPSEISLDHWDFDYKIGNVSDLLSLQFTVEHILTEHNLLKIKSADHQTKDEDTHNAG